MNAPPLADLLERTATVVQAVQQGRSLSDALPRVPEALRPGVQALAYAVLRRLGSATAARRRLAPKAPPAGVDALLLTALALLWPADAEDGARPYADHTLVDQAVAAMRRRSAASAGFANAVLRRFVRERDALVGDIRADPADPAGRWNHPAWWVRRLQADWPGAADAILAAAQRHPPMTLRANVRRASVGACLERLAAAGIGARALGPGVPQGFVLDAPRPVTQLPGFAEGLHSVQDAAAQLAAPLLLGQPPFAGDAAFAPLPAGARVLDACAAPGGKTAHLLELADLDLLALDVDVERAMRVSANLERLGLRAEVRAADAARPADWWDGRPLDAILLDAPCTASGIVRRHPDVPWLRREADIAQLARTQAALLDALWPLLAPGGRLVYATCSVFKAEGQGAIDAFLQRLKPGEARLVPAAPGHLLPLADNGLQAAPAPAATPDGFFYALIGKG